MACSGYSINASTGALTPFPGNAFVANSDAALAGVHPNGKFVYLKHQLPDGSSGNGLSAFVIDVATGALTRVQAARSTAAPTPAR